MNFEETFEKFMTKYSLKELQKACFSLSQRYRVQKRGFGSEFERIAYLIVRMPATYAAIEAAFSHLKKVTDYPYESILDLGAGPGTVALAARSLFPTLKKFYLIEEDTSMVEIGKSLANNDQELVWNNHSLYSEMPWQLCDLVTLSYVLNELKEPFWEMILKKAWDAAKETLVLIEPGTPQAFSRLKKARELLIQWGGHPLAPCPHSEKCPMREDKWCHFSIRLNRSSWHKRLKLGELSYEDEKYSYLAFGKKAAPLPRGRVVSYPQIRSGHLFFELCSDGKLERMLVTKGQGELYKRAKRIEWGDSFP